MQDLIDKFKAHVIDECSNPSFVHHKWYVKYHLNIIERLINELSSVFPDADRDILHTMIWLHDYGKIIDSNKQYSTTLISGKDKLLELGFDCVFVEKVIRYTKIMDSKLELEKAALEIQIISSAD